jgi:hypothetical protein
MPYFIIQFDKPHHHKKGDYNRDIRRIGGLFPNKLEAERQLCKIMNQNRTTGKFLRIDRNVRQNPIAYADLNEFGGLVRFKSRDGFHWSSAITLQEFRQRLARMSRYV